MLYYGLKRLSDTEKIVSWTSKGFSAKKLATPTITDNSFYLPIKWYGNSNFCLVFKGSCLKQKNTTYTPPNRIYFLFMN